MKFNLMFLLVGLLLSIISKVFQLTNKVKLGNFLVIPAAIFLVLAVVFTLPKVQRAIEKVEGIKQVIGLSFWACIGVVSFQLMMMNVIGNGNKLALFFILPIILAVYMVIKKWMII